jgi:pyruvate dehydrogenase E2 component (dihydrolipoamide acetyltransferase)
VSQPATVPELSSLKGEISHVEPDRVARSIARRSAEIRATVPQVELTADADAAAVTALAAELDIAPEAVLVRACGLALREHPYANAAYRDGAFELYSRVNIGVTVHMAGAMISPALLDADAMALPELASRLQRARERAIAGALTPPELAGTTFTFSSHPAERYTPLVIAPQAAALAAGAIRPAPVVRDGEVIAGTVVTLSLACDHRILFGERAAAFLEKVVELVEDPQP